MRDKWPTNIGSIGAKEKKMKDFLWELLKNCFQTLNHLPEQEHHTRVAYGGTMCLKLLQQMLEL